MDLKKIASLGEHFIAEARERKISDREMVATLVYLLGYYVDCAADHRQEAYESVQVALEEVYKASVSPFRGERSH